jgi:hypothetical protein
MARRLLIDIVDQLRNCELQLEVSSDGLMTNSWIETVETYIRHHREHRFFADRQTLIAEYRRVLGLARYTVAETPQAALSYAEHILQRDDTDAGKRLRNKLDFQGIWGAVHKPASPHPKMARLIDIAKQVAGQKTLVLCTTRAGANELASALVPYAAQVFQLHGGTRGFEKQFRAFHEARAGIAVATATHEGKLGTVVTTIIHYNLLTPDLQYLRGFTPLPLKQSLLITVDHPLDLGRGFYRPGVTPRDRDRGTAPFKRRRRQKDELTGSLFPES